MFTCFKSCTGSGQGKAKKSGWLGRFWRRLIRPFTHFRHDSHRESKVTQATLSRNLLVSPPSLLRSLPGCMFLVYGLALEVRFRSKLILAFSVSVLGIGVVLGLGVSVRSFGITLGTGCVRVRG